MTYSVIREWFKEYDAWQGGSKVLCGECAAKKLHADWLRNYTHSPYDEFDVAYKPIEVDRKGRCMRCGKRLWARYTVGRYLWR